jgi:hypothetical protein
MNKIIYFGLPGLFCSNPECSEMTGLAAWAAEKFGLNGVILTYEGSYFVALCAWFLSNSPPPPPTGTA